MPESTKSEITTTATVVAITAGDPPTLTTVKRAVNPQGIARHITQKVAVRDARLFKRLHAEVEKGDEIKTTLVTDLSAVDYTMSLVDFVKAAEDVPAAATVRELAAQSA